MSVSDVEFLIGPQWLATRSGDPTVVLIDTRPPAEYWAGHLEGARHFDPFPFHHGDTGEAAMNEFRSQLAWIFSAIGITGRETVVFYENESGMRATRGVTHGSKYPVFIRGPTGSASLALNAATLCSAGTVATKCEHGPDTCSARSRGTSSSS